MARPRSKLTLFILSLPKSLSAKEVIAKAKAKGMKVSASSISRVRRELGGASKAKASIARANKSAARRKAGRPSAASAAESLLKAVAAEMGIGNAIAILENERARVRTVLGG